MLLDDIFSGVFFTPDGDLLDVSSDEDVDLGVTLSSISISEGREDIPFAQYAVLGDSPDVTGVGGRSGHAGAFLRPRPASNRRTFRRFSMEASPVAPGDRRTRVCLGRRDAL